MSLVEVRDHALWLKHIHGNEDLKSELMNLNEGDLVELDVDGFCGMWKAIGKARKHWYNLQSKRGELVIIQKAASKSIPPATG